MKANRHRMLAPALLCLAAAQARADAMLVPDVGGAPVSVPVRSVVEHRYGATVRQRYDFSCGSAALATLLTYQYGVPVSEDNVFQEMFARGNQARIRREGFSLLDLRSYLKNAHGLQADGYAVPLEKLAGAGIPAVVLINEGGYNHFVVVKGLRPGRVLLSDPSVGTRVMTRARFDTSWPNHVLFVIRNKAPTVPFNSSLEWDRAPPSPLAEGVDRHGLGELVMPKLGPGGF